MLLNMCSHIHTHFFFKQDLSYLIASLIFPAGKNVQKGEGHVWISFMSYKVNDTWCALKGQDGEYI